MNHIRKKTREYINSLTTSNMPKSKEEIIENVKKKCGRVGNLSEQEVDDLILEEYKNYE